MSPRASALRQLLASGPLARDGITDAQLLDRFLTARDEAAFRTVVNRHAPMVYGVCRRVLGNHHDAEDAFQATFLVLARRAGAACRERLGPWLHGIALRTALKARVAASRRRAHECRAAQQRPVLVEPPAPTAELGPVLDEEIRRLPADLQCAVLLCDLRGYSRRRAARLLGCPESTLSSRLAVARRRLARQLSRRGVAPCLTGLAAAVPLSLAQQTTRIALRRAAEVPFAVAALTDEVIRAMTLPRKTLLAALALTTVLVGGTLMSVARERPEGAGQPLTPGDGPATQRPLDRFRFLAFDGFDGQLGLNWRPVRYDPSHVSLTRAPGRLTLTTQRGSIHRKDLVSPAEKAAGMEASPEADRTKNIFVIDNPLAEGADFTITTCVVHFKPAKQYQQAGLILYTDDDNYVKWTYEFNDDYVKDYVTNADQASAGSGAAPGGGAPEGSGRPFFIAVVETKGEPSHAIAAEAGPNLPSVWLRVQKRGNLYDCSTSTDGGHFVKRGTVDWGKGGPKRVGLIAQNGGEAGVPEIDAQFEFFEMRAR